jgi:hypothetical protein
MSSPLPPLSQHRITFTPRLPHSPSLVVRQLSAPHPSSIFRLFQHFCFLFPSFSLLFHYPSFTYLALFASRYSLLAVLIPVSSLSSSPSSGVELSSFPFPLFSSVASRDQNTDVLRTFNLFSASRETLE